MSLTREGEKHKKEGGFLRKLSYAAKDDHFSKPLRKDAKLAPFVSRTPLSSGLFFVVSGVGNGFLTIIYSSFQRSAKREKGRPRYERRKQWVDVCA